MVRKRVSILGSGAVLAVVVALTGCAPAVLPHAAAPKIRASAAATPSPSAIPSSTNPSAGPLPANALFRITATVTEKSGATVDLEQTVYAPGPATAAGTSLLDDQCNGGSQPDWETAYADPQLLTTTITATLRPGSPAWDPDDQVVAYFLTTASAYTGSYEVGQSACAPGYIAIPGTIQGVAAVDATEPATGKYGWASKFGLYGFDGEGNDPSAPDNGTGTGVVAHCHIELSAAAKAASSAVADWLTTPVDPTLGCSFQGSDG
jgi:hypothetical protein